MQDLERAFVARHVELISRPAFERAALVCAYLRLDAEGAEEAERAARDRRARHVEVNRDLAAPFQMNAAGRVKQAGELGEPIAVGTRCDRGELVAKILRE